MTSPVNENLSNLLNKNLVISFLKKFCVFLLLSFLSGALFIKYILVLVTPHLPTLTALTNYNPKRPLRIFSLDKQLIGEFGAERRIIVHHNEIPAIVKKAILAIEDERFYKHHGIDFIGILRATLINIMHGSSAQGGSTITMQVARAFFLTNEKTFIRKLYEIILAYKIENNLTKEQILELYMNQIYLGQHSYGFANAALVYFNRPLKELTLAQTAMIAGLPQAPSIINPKINFNAAKQRQQQVLKRLLHLNWITKAEYEQAYTENVNLTIEKKTISNTAAYVAEMVRQMMVSRYGEDAYTQGFTVMTTVDTHLQNAGHHALRQRLLKYEEQYPYRGPETSINLSQNNPQLSKDIINVFKNYPDNHEILTAIVLEVHPNKIVVGRLPALQNTTPITLDLTKLEQIVIEKPHKKTTDDISCSAHTNNFVSSKKIKPGSVIRINQHQDKCWRVIQLPEVQGALIAMDPTNGAIRTLIGGFDFNLNKYNHVSQAWRQSGSCFKPFIFSAAVEKGFNPATMIEDTPLMFDAKQTGSKPWAPKNYGGIFEGSISMRRALVKSKNVATVRIMQNLGIDYVRDFLKTFGFDMHTTPPYLTSALGAGTVTPLYMARAYSVFANGGYRINPYLIKEIRDGNNNIIWKQKPLQAHKTAPRAIKKCNAYIMDNLLKDAAQRGTGARSNILNRKDIAGKTGTTNDSHDAWFAGYTPDLVTITWMGYDMPRSLGPWETGSGTTLSIWIDFMKEALKNKKELLTLPPQGVSIINNELYCTQKIPINKLTGNMRLP